MSVIDDEDEESHKFKNRETNLNVLKEREKKLTQKTVNLHPF